jgi:hypothetical protein
MRTVAAAALAMFLVGLSATPAAAFPQPLQGEWWFVQWGVTDHLWPKSQGDGVTVAVLDSGVQANLPELADAVVPGIDMSGHGGNGEEDIDDAAVPGHGTAMAAYIAARGGGTGFLGVAPEAKILPVALPSLNAPDAQAIHYAVDHGAKVINMSFGVKAPCPTDVQQAVAYAIQHDVVLVAAAGNNGASDNASVFPANCPGVLAVGATDGQNHPWSKTERQPYVAMAAPGVTQIGLLRDGQIHTADGGTSGAAALTSGAVALVRSAYPEMSARQVVEQIIGSGIHIDSGWNDADGYGVIRPHRVLDGLVPKNGPNPVFAAYDRWAAAHGQPSGSGAGNTANATPSASKGFHWATPLALSFAVILLILGLVTLVNRRNGGRKARTYRELRQQQTGPYPPQGHGPPHQAYAPPPQPGYGPPLQGGQPQPWPTGDQHNGGQGPPPSFGPR